MLKQVAGNTGTKPGQLSRGCAVLFGIPFLGGGLLVTWLGLSSNWNALRARSWVAHPCTVIEAEARVSRSSKGGSSVKAVASYRYEWNTQTFTSDRVCFTSGSDNIGSFQRDVARQLRSVAGTPGAMQCWVNPENPAESVIFRDARWEMQLFFIPFMILFPLVGFSAMVFRRGLTASGSLEASQALAAVNPGMPWLWREDWAAGFCRSEELLSTRGILILGGWTVFVLSAIFGSLFLTDVWTTGRVVAAVVCGSLLALCALIFIHSLRARMKFGILIFVPEELPPQPGRPLRGIIELPARLSDPHKVRARVVVSMITLKDRDTAPPTLESVQARVETTLRNFLIHADLPAAQPPSRNPDDSTGVRWQLVVKGPDGLRGTFDLPVYLTI